MPINSSLQRTFIVLLAVLLLLAATGFANAAITLFVCPVELMKADDGGLR